MDNLEQNRPLVPETPKQGHIKPFDVFDAYFDSSSDAFSELSHSFEPNHENSFTERISSRWVESIPPIILSFMAGLIWLLLITGFKYSIVENYNAINLYAWIWIVWTPISYLLARFNNKSVRLENKKQALHMVLFWFFFILGFFFLT